MRPEHGAADGNAAHGDSTEGRAHGRFLQGEGTHGCQPGPAIEARQVIAPGNGEAREQETTGQRVKDEPAGIILQRRKAVPEAWP